MNMQRNSDDKPSAGKSKPSGSAAARSQEQGAKSIAIDIPQISLPKGGGAIKGIDEKFEVNAANGTAAFSLPLPWKATPNMSSGVEDLVPDTTVLETEADEKERIRPTSILVGRVGALSCQNKPEKST